MDENIFLKLWDASARLQRKATLAGKLALTAEEMQRLTGAYACVVTTFLPQKDTGVDIRSVAQYPIDAQITPTHAPVFSFELRDDFNARYGLIEIYTAGQVPLNEKMVQVAGMLGDSAAFAISQLRTRLASAAPNDVFRQMVEMANEGIWMVGAEGAVTYVNQAMADMLGYERRKLIGTSFYSAFAPEEAEVTRKIVEAHLIGKLGPREISMKRKDGSSFWCHISSAQILDDDGNLIGLLGVTVDISERKRVEDALRNKQAALETALDVNSNIIDSAFDVVCVCDQSERFVSVSKRASQVWGYEPDELIGIRFGEFVREEQLESGLKLSEDIKAGYAPQEPVRIDFRAKDGRFVEMAASVSWNPKHQLMFLFLRDMTAQRELEARLRQSQRLEAIGQLTGGVAHDFNNLLTVILGNAEALASRLSHDASSKLLAEMTRTAAERGADLTNRLLSFARQQALEPKPSDINELVTRMDGLIRRMIDDDIEIEFTPGGNLLPALVDASQLEAAILNIAVNARDAMPDGGRFSIVTSGAHLHPGNADLPPEVTSGDFVLLSLSDTGSGMDGATLARAFEPFFTTKAVGEGSGLGLSMVYGFIKQSGGHIVIESAPGRGTCVKLFLPVSVAEKIAEPDVVTEPEAETGQELILLVEDNDLVRSFVEDQLESLGYRVISVENGNLALAVLREEKGIDLLFTDVVMPGGLNGRQLAEEARKLRADIKVLFTSGYSEDTIIHDGRLDEGVQLLSKPYKRRELADKVRLVLEAGEKV
ncbi:MAG: PAS domain S-box protein [Parvibaculum sp.]|nr:PAS domain S-box protein [Parvibaculum sp.]